MEARGTASSAITNKIWINRSCTNSPLHPPQIIRATSLSRKCLSDESIFFLPVVSHRIKSAEAAITRVLKDVKSRRRMILTGYPLQNNLMEYWCMIDFVRPFLLGNETEFANLFKNPIENGQCADSSDHDRRIMRQRTYILQRTLCRIVQRRDSKPLIAELPKKREFAIIFRQTPSQGSLYRSLFEELTRHRETFNCVALYTTFRNITHHPAIFFAHLKKLSESVSEGSGQQEVNGPIRQLLIDLVKQGKWERFLANLGTFKFDEIHSGKILFLKHLVLEAVVKRKEKIIIFSQSIDVLEYLQEYLPTLLPRVGGEEKREFPITFRIDGSTSSSERERLINLFNDESHETRMFLISTEAGGIGINLTGGCRVVLLDVSWNPSKDIQAISRIYRYGQNRISTIYRLVGDGSMERCVFDRQIHKQFLFKRVVDDKSPMLAINQTDLGSLFSVDGLTTSADWHKVCEEPFPEEAKADEILGSLEGSRTFRQYLSMAPIVMDSILEADDTAQLSEFERREAETSFMREKRPETSSMRRPLPASSTRGSSYMTGPSFQRISAPVAVRPFPLAHGSRSGIPKAIQIPLDAAIRDPVLLMECKSRILKREDFGEIIQQYGTMTRMRISKHLIPDSQGNPSETYVLQPPGAVFSFVFKSDGSVWQMMHAAPDPPRTAVAVPEISVQASPVDLHNA